MTENIACCGLDCGKCRAYTATRRNDREMAGEIAKLWSSAIEGTYTADDIWCDGCHSDRLHGFCVRCPPRLCAKDKGLANCGVCGDYPCGKLEALYDFWIESSPAEARANLERVRARTPPS
jgi:hypothetical protein